MEVCAPETFEQETACCILGKRINFQIQSQTQLEVDFGQLAYVYTMTHVKQAKQFSTDRKKKYFAKLKVTHNDD